MKVLLSMREILVSMSKGKHCMVCGKDLNGNREVYVRYRLLNFLCRKCFSDMRRVGKRKVTEKSKVI